MTGTREQEAVYDFLTSAADSRKVSESIAVASLRRHSFTRRRQMATGKPVTDRYAVPVGAGGTIAHIGRMIVTLCTFGFVFPNSFIEGMNATEIDGRFKPKESPTK